MPADLSPADLARIALKQIAAAGLPPTPEQFARHYHAAAGTPNPADTPQAATRQMVEAVRDTVTAAAATTASLAELIQDSNHDMQRSLDSLEKAGAAAEVSESIVQILRTAGHLHDNMTESGSQLDRLAIALRDMRDEMAATRRLHEHDQLTGAKSRQGMDDLLAREVSRACSYGNRLAIALLELDNIGQLGQQDGAALVERVLIHIANLAKAVLRQNDYLVRYSNEEFLLVLPDTDLTGCRHLVDRLRQVLRKNPMVFQSRAIEVTLSAGIAQLLADEPAAALVLRADQALHAAQASGQNQTASAQSTSLLGE